MTPDDGIERLLKAVSDRGEANWDEMERSSSTPEGRGLVRNLRALRDIAEHGAPLPRYELPLRGSPDASAAQSTNDSAADFGAKTWSHLTLLEKIGEGSYGEVYRAWDPKLSIDVALKLIPDGLTSTEDALREGRMLARVRHENVARVFGVDRADDRVGIWTEYVDGGTLRDVVREEAPLGEARLLEMSRHLLDALAAIHDAKILHRDLKPENVLVEKTGRLVVTDFGCGALRTDLGADRRAQFAGTPRFLAPELFSGGTPSTGTDCYALGVILFLLATGEYPIEAKEVAALREAHRTGARRRLAVLRPDLPPAFAASIDRALDPEPARRPKSARDWSAEMQQGAEAVSLTPAHAAARFDAAPAPTGKQRSGRRAPLWAIAGVGVAAIAGAAWIGLRGAGPLTFEAELLRARGAEEWTKIPSVDAFAGTPPGTTPGTTPGAAVGATVRPGDRLMLSFDSPQEAYVYVVNWDDAGRAYLLFPMQGSELRNPLAPRATHHLPGPVGGAPFAWEVSSAGGREHFAVVTSRDRLVEFESSVAEIARVRVKSGNANDDAGLPADAFAGLLRGVGRASVVERGPAGARPEAIVEELKHRISSDSDLRRRVAIRVFTVENAGG